MYHDLDFSWSSSAGDDPIPLPAVSLAGYSFGPGGTDDGGAGDDIPLTTPVIADSFADGTYRFPGVAPGNYTVTAETPPGLVPAEVPAMPVHVEAGAVIAGIDFGFRDPVTPPIAIADAAHTRVGEPVVIAVLDNDVFPADARVTITGVSAASDGGVVTIAPDGLTVTFAPAADTTTAVTFTYTITDKVHQVSTATVTVSVSEPPTAVDDDAETGQTQSVVIPVLDNDSGSQLVVTQTTVDPQRGTVVVNADGTVTFTPAPGLTASAAFALLAAFAAPADVVDVVFGYVATDSFGDTATANVTVAVVAEPVAVPDEATTAAGVPVDIPVLDNDSGRAVAIASVAPTAAGGVAIAPGMILRFTPQAGFSGTALFGYTIVDDLGQTAEATVSVVVAEGPGAVAPPDGVDGAAIARTGVMPVEVPLALGLLLLIAGLVAIRSRPRIHRS